MTCWRCKKEALGSELAATGLGGDGDDGSDRTDASINRRLSIVVGMFPFEFGFFFSFEIISSFSFVNWLHDCFGFDRIFQRI